MNKRITYPRQVLNGFRSVRNCNGEWVIELKPGRFLHYLEGDDTPKVINSQDHAAQTFPSKEKADSIIGWLKRLWSEDETDYAPFARH